MGKTNLSKRKDVSYLSNKHLYLILSLLRDIKPTEFIYNDIQEIIPHIIKSIKE
jgi:hypothetical protein